jgi:glucose uptake protein
MSSLPYQPQTYLAQLGLMLGSMLCWGSWASTLKLTRGWPFALFYWDYVVGVLGSSIVFGWLLGGGAGFVGSLGASDGEHILLALAAGVIFNLANQLLVAAIEIAGLAVAFPVGIGVALVLGVILNYLLAPLGSARLLFGGVAMVLLAIVLDALAYRMRDATRQQLTARGLVLSLVSGLLMGLFYPVLTRSMQPPHGFSPYAALVFFAIGVGVCAVPVNLLMMKKPLTGGPSLQMKDFRSAPASFHAAGMLGGLIWMAGATLNVAAAQGTFVGPAISYAAGQGATMVSAVWGVFVWREFAGASGTVNRLLALMFLAFVLGLTLIALAPLHR